MCCVLDDLNFETIGLAELFGNSARIEHRVNEVGPVVVLICRKHKSIICTVELCSICNAGRTNMYSFITNSFYTLFILGNDLENVFTREGGSGFDSISWLRFCDGSG